MTTDYAIEIKELSKSYGKVKAVDGVSIDVPRGQIYGLIGPDGAGKTTMFRMLATLMMPDSGQLRIAGLDVVRDFMKLRAILGYMPGRFSLYGDLTVQENLKFFATLFSTTVEEGYELIHDIYAPLEPFKKRKAANLSGGMKQKLALSCALVHRPEVLLLDEPTTGVDPVSRREFWSILTRLREQGMTIFVSTPYMDEATLCDQIAFMRHGQIIACSPPAELVANYRELLYAIEGNPMSKLLRLLKFSPHVRTVYSFGDVVHVTLTKEATITRLEREISEMGRIEGLQIECITPSVEDCYLELAVKKGREES